MIQINNLEEMFKKSTSNKFFKNKIRAPETQNSLSHSLAACFIQTFYSRLGSRNTT
jgi:hypothetical protein